MGHHLRCFSYLNNPEEINQIQLDKFSFEQSKSISNECISGLCSPAHYHYSSRLFFFLFFLPRYAIIQIFEILIFRDVSHEKLRKISHKE